MLQKPPAAIKKLENSARIMLWQGTQPVQAPAEGLGSLLESIVTVNVSVAEDVDCHADIQRAFDNAYGKIIYFPPRRYYLGARSNGRLTMPRKCYIIFAKGAYLDASGWGTSGSADPILYAEGTYDDADVLAANATIGDNTLTLGTGAGSAYNSGDKCYLASDEMFTTQDAAVGTKGEHITVNEPGDTLTIAGVLRDSYNATALTGTAQAGAATTITLAAGAPATLSGNTITLTGGTGSGQTRIIASYDGGTRVATVTQEWDTIPDNTSQYSFPANARLYRFTDLCEISILNPQIIGSGGDIEDEAIVIINGFDCHVYGGSIKYTTKHGIDFTTVLKGTIESVEIINEDRNATNPTSYPIVLNNGCEQVVVSDCDATHGREGYALSATGGIQGVTRDCHFIGNRARGMWRSGYCTHDVHTGIIYDRNIAEDCEQGFDFRIPGALARNNIIRRMGAFSGTLDCGFQLGSGSTKTVIKGNYIEDALRGVYMAASVVHETAPGDIDIIDNDMLTIRGHGVSLEYTTGETYALGTVTVQGLRLTGNGTATTVGVQVEGKWKVVVDDLELRNGNGGRAVFLHATANGTGTNGPVNPVINNVKYESSFTEPLVQHNNGGLTAVGNSIIGLSAPSAITLTAAGAATMPILPFYTITSNSGTADDFDSITAMAAGTRVTYQPTSGHTITVRNNGGGTGNIRTKCGASVVLSGDETITFVCDGTNWDEVSDNPGEGTFTPAITFDTAGDLSVTYSTQVGRYSKVGRLVFFDITLVTSAFTHTTASGNLRITGLPFTVGATYSPLGKMEWQGITKASYTDMAARLVAGQTYALVIGSGSGVANSAVTATNMPTGGSVRLVVSGCYAV